MATTAPSEDEVLGYFDTLSNWGRWGPDDQLGTLNLVTPAKRAAAARLVQDGEAVSCAWDIEPRPHVGQAVNPQRFMIASGEGLADEDRVRGFGMFENDRMAAAVEFLGLVFHGMTVTHLDGLCHVFWDGKMYNGQPAAKITTSRGATHHAITALRHGVMSRGVLLDVAALRGVDWLEPGEGVFPDELEAAEQAQGVRVEEGDVLLLRTGHGKLKRQEGPSKMRPGPVPGYHAACLPWLKERGVAVIGSDTAQDVSPSGYEQITLPVHAVGIVAMGLWLIDNCNLEDLAATAASKSRYEFQFFLGPLRVVGGTGSPVNPVAVF